ncbi:DNA polymerase type-B family protein [Aeromonas veronii]|uniref:hypothetical protein n=1 Tax=Aeromonas veronii TaxID=654 RepID=UPI000CD4975D|nr:hypothetical protein [Aeromonas veronii]MCX0428065.1 DNA polymerase [Aeromonas veronii]MCX0449734.1 DNA polymerase [Aeromonas veronii]POG17011.1 hypothetical protein C2849_21785 [Aeromonas veronii]
MISFNETNAIDEEIAPVSFSAIHFDSDIPRLPVKLADGEDLWLGLDAEWVQENGLNMILSYQVFAVNHLGLTLGKVYYPDKGKRLTFEKFISQVVADCRTTGLIKRWPRKIVVVAHFLRADLTTFGNFWGLKGQVKAQGGSVVGRILTGSGYGVDETVERARKAKPAPIVLRDRNRREQQSIIEFVDTLFLAPNKSPLSALGIMLGLPKVEIPDGYSIERMDELLAGNREAFEQYALRDAEIAARYALKVRDFLGGQFGLQKLPRSLGAVSVSVFRRLLKDADIDYMTAFGLEIAKLERWNAGTGKVTTTAVKRPSPARGLYEDLAIRCYHGGRNESFMMGPTPIGDWYDWDLKGAYTTGLCDLLVPDYANMHTSSDPQDFIGHVMGFAYVEFAFPTDTRFPCLPVRSEQYGLRFPLSGLAYVTAPEIELALSMGATIVIKHGVIVPWIAGSQPLFEDFTRMIQRLRREYPKKSLEEVMVKEVGNSLYGKLAQGLSDKTAFDTATGLSKKIGPSAVTNPYMAAHTTGLIRAVCGELLHRILSHRTVVSVTTDGFLTDAPLEELDQTGPLCRRYQALCQQLHGGESGEPVPMLELKHHARQIVSIKTRGQCTAIQGDTPPVLAKAGVKCAGTTEEQNTWILRLYLDREPGQKIDASHLISLREQWLTESDLIEIKKQIRLPYEFDQKRQLVNPQIVEVAGGSHIACDTVPWGDAGMADHCRARFDGWREDNCLKTMEDWASWEDYYESALALQGSTMRIREDGSLGILARILTRSLAQKAWFDHMMTYGEISALLTSVGLPVTVDTCKNSKRAVLPQNVVPVTGEVLRVLALLLRQLPGYPLEPLFKPERLAEVKRRLAELEITHD